MDPVEEFRQEVAANIEKIGKDADFLGFSNVWEREATRMRYSYNFSWLGRPIIQIPQDVYAMQELIWSYKPDLIIETGIAHGGSLILSASMLAMLDYCEAVESGSVLDPRASRRKVVGVDIDIRAHNRAAIEAHPMAHKISMIQGSAIAPDTFDKVKAEAAGHDRIMIFLDSNHTHEHVLEELELYAPLTSQGSYCVVWDTIVEDMPAGFYSDRPWDKGANPKTAVWDYMKTLSGQGRTAADGAPLKFELDKIIENKIVLSNGPDGFLKRI